MQSLGPGEVGYLITGVKNVRETKVGDTITWASNGATEPLKGYADPKPMVYSGLFPISQADSPTCAMRWRSCSLTTPP